MKKIENTALQMIAEASRCPDYGPDMVKSLMKKLDMNEKGFALLMNVAPSTVRLWTSGAAQPCGTAKRLMQIYETGPEIVGKIAGGQLPSQRLEKYLLLSRKTTDCTNLCMRFPDFPERSMT